MIEALQRSRPELIPQIVLVDGMGANAHALTPAGAKDEVVFSLIAATQGFSGFIFAVMAASSAF